MNKINLIGRLTKDVETRGEGEKAVAKYTLAVERRYKKEGDAEADFLNIVAFGKAGEFANKYFHKGMKVAVVGRVQTGSYTNKDGQKVYTFDVVAEEQEFVEKKSESTTTTTETKKETDDFMDLSAADISEYPF